MLVCVYMYIHVNGSGCTKPTPHPLVLQAVTAETYRKGHYPQGSQQDFSLPDTQSAMACQRTSLPVPAEGSGLQARDRPSWARYALSREAESRAAALVLSDRTETGGSSTGLPGEVPLTRRDSRSFSWGQSMRG